MALRKPKDKIKEPPGPPRDKNKRREPDTETPEKAPPDPEKPQSPIKEPVEV